MPNQGSRRTRIQEDELLRQILKLEVECKTVAEACEILGLPERTYYFLKKKVEDRIIVEQTSRNYSDILMHKEICRERISYTLKALREITENEKNSARVRMDSLWHYSEVSMAALKLETETISLLLKFKELKLKEPIPLEEIEGSEPVEASVETENEDVSEVQ